MIGRCSMVNGQDNRVSIPVNIIRNSVRTKRNNLSQNCLNTAFLYATAILLASSDFVSFVTVIIVYHIRPCR